MKQEEPRNAEREYVQRELPFVPIAPTREVLTAAEEIASPLERARGAARELLDLQCNADDPERAFVGALEILMRVADVSDNFPRTHGVHPRTALHVLIREFGIEKVRDWTRQINRQIAKAAKQDED